MTDKTQPNAHAEITAPISADLRRIEQEAQELPEPSPTVGMNLGQRILHVGGRENEAGYIEFGSVAAVRALVGQVLRDLQPAQPVRECLQQSATVRDAAAEKPEAGRYVLAWMEGKAIPIRAMWVPSKWLQADDECHEDWAEYDEAKDEYFCPEGWYEKNEHEEKNWSVSTPVVAWMELPRLDAALQAAPPAPQGLITQQVEDALLDAGLPADMREEIMTDVTAPAAAPAHEHATQLAGEAQDGQTPWLPYLSDRADGVRGHYAIARRNPSGYLEVWNLRSHQWAAASDEVLTHDEALAILRKLEMPTAPAAPVHAQEDARDAARLQSVLFRMVDQLEDKTSPTRGNAPYHGHGIPGVWDSDNGAKAGTKCGWCELWAEAVAMRDAARAAQGGAA